MKKFFFFLFILFYFSIPIFVSALFRRFYYFKSLSKLIATKCFTRCLFVNEQINVTSAWLIGQNMFTLKDLHLARLNLFIKIGRFLSDFILTILLQFIV